MAVGNPEIKQIQKVAQGLNTARAAARNTLITNHQEEYDTLVSENMRDLGFVEKVITKTKWELNGSH